MARKFTMEWGTTLGADVSLGGGYAGHVSQTKSGKFIGIMIFQQIGKQILLLRRLVGWLHHMVMTLEIKNGSNLDTTMEKDNLYIVLYFALISCLLVQGCKEVFFTEKPIKLVTIPFQENEIYIYKSLSNATVNESIQIRTNFDSINSKKIFIRYDSLHSYFVTNSELKLILVDTGRNKIKVDTFNVDIESLW